MVPTQLEPIEASLLATVTGGEMQWAPGVLATMDSLARKKRPDQTAPAMQQAALAVGNAMSSLTTSLSQSKEQSSQAMMQMLPQMMGR